MNIWRWRTTQPEVILNSNSPSFNNSFLKWGPLQNPPSLFPSPLLIYSSSSFNFLTKNFTGSSLLQFSSSLYKLFCIKLSHIAGIFVHFSYPILKLLLIYPSFHTHIYIYVYKFTSINSDSSIFFYSFLSTEIQSNKKITL